MGLSRTHAVILRTLPLACLCTHHQYFLSLSDATDVRDGKSQTHLSGLNGPVFQNLGHAFILIACSKFILQCGFTCRVPDVLCSMPIIIVQRMYQL